MISYGILKTFILSKSHHRSLLNLKKALNDIHFFFQSKHSIGRFSVHRECVILASTSDLLMKNRFIE